MQGHVTKLLCGSYTMSSLLRRWRPFMATESQTIGDHPAFYRAMHFSAKRGIAIACRLSVRLSVTFRYRDHIGRKSRKLTARTISRTPSFFGAQRAPTYSQGNMGKFWGEQRGVGKNGVLEHKSGNSSETRTYREKVTMGSLQELTCALSNGTIPDPLRPPLPQYWGFTPHPKLQ